MERNGLETFIMNVYRKINRNKIQFDFLVHTEQECAYNNEIRRLGGKIFSVSSRRDGILKNYYDLNNFFENHPEYSIVHQHLSSLSYVRPLKIAKNYDVPIRVVHAHSTKASGLFIHKYLHKFNRIFVKSFATHFWACSKSAAKWLYPSKQYKNHNFKIIKNGVDLNQFCFNKKSRVLKRKEIGIENKFVIGHVGRFMPVKNHMFLIDIFENINKKIENTVLLLVGDGEIKKEVENKVEKLGLKDKVVFTGVRKDIPGLLNAMDVFVMPSIYEGLPVSLIEAQVTGLPCVLSDNITNEVKLINNIDWISLDDNLSEWVDSIIEYKYKDIDRMVEKEISKSGYNINEIVKNMEKFYLRNVK